MLTETDYAYVSAAELARRVREREVSAVELLNACIERIETRNPSLNAFVYQGFDDARAAAKEADVAVRSGAELGVLHGVPTAIKDRIFYPLVSGREGGSGLGLTLAQTFVQQHHGVIECDSVPGRTDFKLLIPLP